MLLNRKNMWFILIGLLTGLSLLVLSNVRAKHWRQDTSQNRENESNVPEVVSCAKDIRIVRTEMRNAGTEQAFVAIEVENKSELNIIAIALETAKKGQGKHEVITSGFSPDKEPLVIIPAHGSRTVEFGNFFADETIWIGSVMFADGTEEGCAPSLKSLHEVKERKLHQKKESGPQ